MLGGCTRSSAATVDVLVCYVSSGCVGDGIQSTPCYTDADPSLPGCAFQEAAASQDPAVMTPVRDPSLEPPGPPILSLTCLLIDLGLNLPTPTRSDPHVFHDCSRPRNSS